MENSYIVRIRENDLACFYYQKEFGIVYKTYEKGRWKREEIIIKGTRSNFTVTLDSKKNIYIFCQDSFGDIILCTNKAGTWQNKVILKNQSGKIYEVLITPLISEKGISIIYNMPSSEDKSNYLVFQQMDKEGKWLPAIKIDKFIPMLDRFYYIQNITSEHFLLFYQTRTHENNLGYREMTLEKHGNFNVFHTTAYQIVDSSFLTSNNAIHVAYITKSMFSSQLVYRKKETDQFTNSIVIWEGQKIENCLLFFALNKLYICFLNNKQLYYCVSENSGNTFSKPNRYKNKFCLNPIKSPYIFIDSQNESKFLARQIYVDKNNISDIQILPDLCEEFYPRPIVAKNTENEEQQINQENIEKIEEIMKIKNLLSVSEKQNSEKDKQILQLTTLLKNRNDEINVTENQKKKMLKSYYEEKEELLYKLKKQENDYNNLKTKYEELLPNLEKKEQSQISEKIEKTDNFDIKENDISLYYKSHGEKQVFEDGNNSQQEVDEIQEE